MNPPCVLNLSECHPFEVNEPECKRFDANKQETSLEDDEGQSDYINIEIQQQAIEPKVGAFYNDIDQLFESYLRFARMKGFSVAKKFDSKDTGSFRKYMTICCDRGRKSIANKHTKSINCLARLSAILRENGMWQVSKVVEEHNHELAPSMSRFMLAHRSINPNGRPWTTHLRSSHEPGHRTVRKRVANNSQQQRRTNSRPVSQSASQSASQYKSQFKQKIVEKKFKFNRNSRTKKYKNSKTKS
ncbi:hypothetical protein M9H77_04679 [Catharanthus roseus]|uniref:Uncharacterized protein n=1 Tax=Catharanthus roseus TaxID=4058 RepID=A0ACC0CET5_CATRO|nr:hypothetical protein M9H77_04679 [Catharanthus roseus]